MKHKRPRVLQFFLTSAPSPIIGVFEVSEDEDGLTCNCPGFTSKRQCKHIRFVEDRIKKNDGVYPLKVSTSATQVDADKAASTPAEFREFILKYGKVEIL